MSGLPKLLIIYAIAIPLAIVLGFLVSAPGMGSVVIVGMLLFLFSLQFLLKNHHVLLILAWNSAFNAFFLPGQPHFWLLMAVLSLGISWLNSIMGQKNFIKVRELTLPMIFFALVVIATAFARGGLGVRTLGGSSYGGRGYAYILGAIVGYFALAGERIPLRAGRKWAGWYFLSGSTFGLSNLVFILGPAFYFLYLLVPPDYAMSQAQEQIGTTEIARIAGLAPACAAVVFFFLVRYGIKGVLNWQAPWRIVVFSAAVVFAGFGGFRSVYLLISLICLVQFFLEGLYRTIYLPISIGLATVALALVAGFSRELPLSLQRAVSFLPIQVDSSVAADAAGSWDWRVSMWKTLLPEIPQYLLVGKGYRIDPEDLYLASLAVELGTTDQFEVSRVAGDYHNGPLSLIISFGLIGVAAFLWLIVAGTRTLIRNYRYGHPSLLAVNRLLLAFFIAHVIFFVIFFGDIRGDLFIFTGALGLSVSLNGGEAKKPVKTAFAQAAQLVPQAA